MRFLLLLLFVTLLYPKDFSVANYNVENLFDDIKQGSEYDDYIPNNQHGWNHEMFEAKLNHTAEVICDLDADIIALEEIENSYVLNRLKERLVKVGCAYPFSAITSKKGAPIQVALLSKFQIKSKNEIIVNRSPRVRNILEVVVSIDGLPLRIFANHWKSRANNGQESKRLSYAYVLKNRIKHLKKGDEYIIIGDLNSDYDVHRTLEKRFNDTGGKTALGDVMATIKDDLLINEEMLRESNDFLHYNLWSELQLKERWNHQFQREKSTIDHILIPKSMIDGSNIDYINDSFFVFKPSYLFDKYGSIYRSSYQGGKHYPYGYSDHLPIIAKFSTQSYVYKQQAQEIPKESSIESLYDIDKLERSVKLKNVSVIYKRGFHALIKETPSSRGIFLFNCAGNLKEGKRYDMTIHDIKSYKGLKEATHVSAVFKGDAQEIERYYQRLDSCQFYKRQNEIFKDIDGVYRNGNLVTKCGTFPIFFKNKIIPPENGDKIKLFYAHLGYHKKLELVVYDRSDFIYLEK